MGWQEFVDTYHIPYQRGSEGKKGKNIQVRCPFANCNPDGKMKMGLHLNSPAYGCWRNESHSGHEPEKLIKLLIRCPEEHAKDLAETFFKHLPKKRKEERLARIDAVNPLSDFLKFGTDSREEKMFSRYLKARGIDPHWSSERFDLRWCDIGRFQYRIIIPIIANGGWMTWTSRAISPALQPKYLVAGDKFTPNKPNWFLFDMDNLIGGDLLILTEGPFDAIKISSAFVPSVSATCIFGKVLYDQQLLHLSKISRLYKKVAISLDPDAKSSNLALIRQMRWYAPNVFPLEINEKDWGECSQSQIREIVKHAS